MAKLSKLAVFWRVFLISLLVGVPVGTKKASAGDSSDWERASSSGTQEAIIWYLRRHPAGDHLEEAIGALVSLDGGTASSPMPRDVKVDDKPQKRIEGGTNEWKDTDIAGAVY